MTKLVQAEPRAVVAPGAPAFRQAMAQVASAVHVVTTHGLAGRAGMTATSVASVSDEPPTVLVCIEGASRTLAAIEASGAFCINTLTDKSEELAAIFARRRNIEGEARFATADWISLATGAPVLADALVAFDCRLIDVHRVATHRILIGEVVALGGTGQGAGLIYRRRGFAAV
jgi:flavin reductase